MKLKPLFQALTLTAFALVGVASTAGGCGTDVASCANVCPSGANGDCSDTCSQIQTSCDNANAGADFQALLTCVANANGALDPLPDLCNDDFEIVARNCGVTGGLPDAGDVVADAGTDG